MGNIRSVCVFSGSSAGRRSDYRRAAEEVGTALAHRHVRLVYGGADVGLMGAVANAAIKAGGEVVGVIPEHLVRHEIAHARVADLRVVGSMHERKTLMAELADGFLALPGGFGTLEETFETLTWTQLGLQAKPTGLLNIAGYFDFLVAFLDHSVDEGFVRPEHRELVHVDADLEQLLLKLDQFTPPTVGKWVDRPGS